MKVTSGKEKYSNFFQNIFRYKKRGYLRYFHNIAGNKLYYSFAASVLMTFLDSIGIGFILALLQNIFIPSQVSDNSILTRVNGFLSGLGFTSISNSFLLTISLLMFLCKGIMSYIQMYLQASINSKILSETRREIVRNITDLKFTNFITTDLGTILNISTTEVNRLNSALHNYLNTMQYVLMSFCYIVIAISTNILFAIMVLVSAGILLYFYNFLIVYFKKLSAKISLKGNAYNSYLQQLLSNYKYLKSTNSIYNYREKVITEINEAESISLKFWKINAITVSAREPIILFIVGIVIVSYYQITNEISTLIIFSLFLFYRTLNYILLTQSNWQNFHQFAGSMDNIIHTQEKLKSGVEKISGNTFSTLKDRLVLHDVAVTLNERLILSEINLEIQKNTTTSLIGSSGAGKSTLASAITSLLPTSSGFISVDGVPLEDFDLSSYRSKIGYVSQDTVIFNDTIFNNVTLWSEKTAENLQHFEEIIQLTQLKKFIGNYAEKENTIVGDGGIMLSGGQKQRVSIARELFKRTEIIVMDEATSSLDSTTEHLIKENLNTLAGKITMIIIAHRLSTIKSADNIVLLDSGKIVASGNFEQLNNNSQLFKDMLKHQNTGHEFI